MQRILRADTGGTMSKRVLFVCTPALQSVTVLADGCLVINCYHICKCLNGRGGVCLLAQMTEG